MMYGLLSQLSTRVALRPALYCRSTRRDQQRNQHRRLWAALVFVSAHGLALAANEPEPATPAAAAPVESSVPHGLNGDLALYSDYIARGLSYSRERFSLQGHFEYDFPQGPYLGSYLIHNSAIVNKETVEIDPFVGYLRRFNDWTIDANVFFWLYPHSRLDASRNRYNTVEATTDVTYKTFGVKVWYDLKNYFGLDSGSAWVDYKLQPHGPSRGSFYIDSHLNLPLRNGLLLRLHAGHQFIRHYGELDYTDWLIGLEKTLGHNVTAGAAYTQTDGNAELYADPHGLNLARGKWLAYLRWSFP